MTNALSLAILRILDAMAGYTVIGVCVAIVGVVAWMLVTPWSGKP